MRGKLAGRAFRAWERFLTTRPFTRILFLSEYSRAEGIALGVPPERACVSSPGFYPAHCAPAPARDDVVLFAGKFETRKGVLDVLEVARALPHIPFRMIGWGPEMDFLKRAAPHNLRIGDETGEAYYRILGRARIFLFPSKGETFGISLLEAMASGCAIVSSVPLEFAGFRVNPGDCASMAAAVARLWETPEMWRTHSERNIQLAASYTWDRYAESVMETYAQVLPVPSVSIRARVFSA